MKRLILQQLCKWKDSSERKPLILNGARQVGKTYILNEFGKAYYKNVVYINLDKDKQAASIWEKDFDVNRIILSLSALLNVSIKPEDTLIILDEIQDCPKALSSLKYFCEDAPEYHVVVAGSLLGLSLHEGVSFPVGKVDMLRLYPMTFREFLMANGEERLADLLIGDDMELIDVLGEKYKYLLRQYYYTGGMPAVVKEYVESHDLQKVRDIQKQILFDYRRDFSKHAPANQVPRINMVWDSIPSQLAKENRKFIYGAIKKGSRASEFEIAIQWLIDAGLVYKIPRVTAARMPLKFYEEQTVFKLFVLDVGLMGAMVDIPARDVLVNDNAIVEYKGSFTELYALTQIVTMGVPVYYYSSNDSIVEIDFIVQGNERVIPIEVKAEVNVKAKALRQFVTDNPDLRGLRLSMLGFQEQNWMENKPLYAPDTWLK
ncbi:MAG: ATP-binding protein [Bacteroidales bacterium]|nr:ATP-binding protein [Bacteroidales bacterium]